MAIVIPHAQLILVEGTSIVSWLIKRATQSPYSHSAFVIDGLTYEIDLGGFYRRDIRRYPWKYDLYNVQGMTPDRSTALRDWCWANRKRPYDMGKVLGQGIEIFWHITGIRSVLDSERALSCTEWIYEGLKHVGILLSKPQAYLTPVDISRDPLVSPAS